MKIKIAVPSKGRISEPSINILEKAGLGLIDKNNRKLISKTFNEDIEVMFARASDIPEIIREVQKLNKIILKKLIIFAKSKCFVSDGIKAVLA